jgi:acetoacetate decarboxylase
VIPAPLEMTVSIVKFEFIKMPDSTSFGDYTESGQVIPVRYRGVTGGYVHAMYLDDGSPLAAGKGKHNAPRGINKGVNLRPVRQCALRYRRECAVFGG